MGGSSNGVAGQQDRAPARRCEAVRGTLECRLVQRRMRSEGDDWLCGGATMCRARALVLLVLALGFVPATAKAQAVPPPGFRELEVALIIARTVFDCLTAYSIGVAANPQPGWEGVRREAAVGKNGRR